MYVKAVVNWCATYNIPGDAGWINNTLLLLPPLQAGVQPAGLEDPHAFPIKWLDGPIF